MKKYTFRDSEFGRLTVLLQMEMQPTRVGAADRAIVTATVVNETEEPISDYEIGIRANAGVMVEQEYSHTNYDGQVTAVLTAGKNSRISETWVEFPVRAYESDPTIQDGRYLDENSDNERRPPRSPEMPGLWAFVWGWVIEQWQRARGWWSEQAKIARLPWPTIGLVGLLAVAGALFVWKVIDRVDPPPSTPTSEETHRLIEMELAGPPIAGVGHVKVPINIISSLIAYPSAGEPSDDSLEVGYSLLENDQPTWITPENTTFEQPNTLYTLAPLPDKLVGQRIWLHARLNDNPAKLSLELTLLPVVEINQPRSAADIVYSAQDGSATIQVNGRIPTGAPANWIFIISDPTTETTLSEQACPTLHGECRLELETDLRCLTYSVKLIAQTGRGEVSADEEITACTDSK